MERISLTASEEMSFENVDGRRTPDACIYYKLTYEPTAQVSSGELKRFILALAPKSMQEKESKMRLWIG